MLKKQIKIKGTANRTELIEFLISKRVKFLEYLKDVHSENGTLWMNCVHLNKFSCGRHFGVNEECLTHQLVLNNAKKEQEEEEEQYYKFKNEKEICIPVEPMYKIAKDNDSDVTEDNINKNEDVDDIIDNKNITITLNTLPTRKNESESIHKWQTSQLPLFTSLSFALSDLISASSMSGVVFIDSLYMLWLEVETAFASNAAAKMLALRHLHQFRTHACRALRESLSLSFNTCQFQEQQEYEEEEKQEKEQQDQHNEMSDVNPSNKKENCSVNIFASSTMRDNVDILVDNKNATSDINKNIKANNNYMRNKVTSDNIPRYLFLKHHQPHLCYSHITCSHDMLIPALCELLIFVYRRMCDYEVMNDTTMVKRIVSCDKKIIKWVISPIVQEINLAAQRQLLEEMYVLSSGGLFNKLNNSATNKNDNVPVDNIFTTTTSKKDSQDVQNKHDISDKSKENNTMPGNNSLIDALWQSQNETQSVSINDESNLEEDYIIDDDDDDEEEEGDDSVLDKHDLMVSSNKQSKNKNNTNNNISSNAINLPTNANRRDTNLMIHNTIELDDADDAFVV